MREKKELRITFRVSEEEYRRLSSKAEKAGMPVGSYVRAAALRHRVTVVDGLRDCTAELKAIGRNLNQLATLANMGKVQQVFLSETLNALRQIYDKLDTLSSREV